MFVYFVVPDLYVQIIPPILPAPLALVYLSGIAEIAVGIGVLIPRTHRYAAWATSALLVLTIQQLVDIILIGLHARAASTFLHGRFFRLGQWDG